MAAAALWVRPGVASGNFLSRFVDEVGGCFQRLDEAVEKNVREKILDKMANWFRQRPSQRESNGAVAG